MQVGEGLQKFIIPTKDILTIDTNVQSFLQLLRCITPNMVKRKRSYYNIGSIAGLYHFLVLFMEDPNCSFDKSKQD